MTRGYAGKLLDVDLTRNKIQDLILDDTVLKSYVGGRGLATHILWDRLGDRWETVDPLGPENLFLALTGPLTGIYPGARVCASGKSPQSNGILGSTTSGEFPNELRCAGYDGVIVSGKASSPVFILVTDNAAEIRDASHLWGLEAFEMTKRITRDIRADLEKRRPTAGKLTEPAFIYCGPAGENRVRTAAVMQKISHAAGYGGYGAVMGSKNLKAIVAKGAQPLPEVWSPQAVQLLRDKVEDLILVTRDRMRRWGTGYGGWEVAARVSAEPVRNWQDEYHDERSFGGDKFDFRYWVKRYWSDFNCITACLKLAVVKTGPYKGAITDNPDYELQAFLGPNLGIFDPGECIYLSALMDYLGLSGINGPNTLAFAAELYQRGILTQQDLGFDLQWGNVQEFEKLAYLMVNREGIGDILAEGTYRAAVKLSELKGIDLLPYAVHVKGVEIGAHGTRSGLDMNPIGYACSVQGGDHTSRVFDAYSDMQMVYYDSAVICSFCSFRMEDLVWEFHRAVTGWDTTKQDWYTQLGPRIMTLQRLALLLGGPDVTWTPLDDDNPPRYYEPLPTGPHQGQTTDKEVVAEQRSNYFAGMGWDDHGIPTQETLDKLNLSAVKGVLPKILP
jgi:aldehyde:ferredoxin oxidoreductase